MSSISAHLPTAAPAAEKVEAELSSYFVEGDVGAAIGVGVFMSFWIGGGFGAIAGGALWNHHNEATLHKS